MESQKSPEETIKESVESHKAMMYLPGNLALNNKILAFMLRQPGISEMQEKLIPFAKPYFKEIISWALLKDLFDLAFYVHYFHCQPYKTLDYIKIKLWKFDLSLRKLHIELLLDIMKDKARFDFTNEALTFLINELESIDPDYHNVFCPSSISDIEFFTEKKEMVLDKAFMTSYCAVRGMLQTKEDALFSFLKENYSPELLSAISKLGLTIVNPPSFDIDSTNKLKRLLSSDILELKPNFAGIGINFNEIIKRLRKGD